MNEELANRATILAAQYAGNGADMLYPPQITLLVIAGISIFLVLLLAVGTFIFDHCIIDDSTLYGTNFSDSSLTDTKITKCDTDECTCNLMLNCPEKGSFTAFKKARSDSGEQVVIELRVPSDAKRSSATSRKCRVSKAKVISITSPGGNKSYKTAHACYKHSFKYTVGEVVKVDDFDKDRWNECAPGIHCFITRQEAVNYG